MINWTAYFRSCKMQSQTSFNTVAGKGELCMRLSALNTTTELLYKNRFIADALNGFFVESFTREEGTNRPDTGIYRQGQTRIISWK